MMRPGGGALKGMRSVDLFDTITLDGATRRTADGYLVTDVKVARTGIQLYRGSEVGRPDLETVRVYRPDTEVFSEDAMRSFAWRPVTVNHPRDPVRADNWRKLAVGQVGDTVQRDGDFIRVPLVLMDAAAIRAVEGGKRQLSMGYSAELVWGDGVTPTGERYDAKQTTIRGNHLAIVDEARGGPALAIGDDENGDPAMTAAALAATAALTTIMVDGISVQMDASAAQIVGRAVEGFKANLDKLQKRLDEEEEKSKKVREAKDAADAALAKATTDHKAALDAKDAEIATLKKQVEDSALTPAKLDAAIKDRAAVTDKAKAYLPANFDASSKTVGEIKDAAVRNYLGDSANGWSADQIATAFDTMTAKAATGSQGRDPIRDGLHATRPGFATDERSKALAERDTARTEAWRTAGRAN